MPSSSQSLMLHHPISCIYLHPLLLRTDAKGRGVVAGGQIPRGTRVVQERPAFLVKKEPTGPSSSGMADIVWAQHWDWIYAGHHVHPDDVTANVNCMSLERKTKWRSLYQGGRSRQPTNIGRWIPNYRPIIPQLDQPPIGFGIFLDGSMFNHSCAPNVHYYWDERTKSMIWRAIENIEAGEELAIDYLSYSDYAWDSIAKRHQDLAYLYNLDCHCPYTTDGAVPREVSARRGGLFAAQWQIFHLLEQRKTLSSLSVMDDYIQNIEQEFGGVEGFGDTTIPRTADPRAAFAYQLIHYYCILLGYRPEAQEEFKRKAEAIERICFGQITTTRFHQLIRYLRMFDIKKTNATHSGGETFPTFPMQPAAAEGSSSRHHPYT